MRTVLLIIFTIITTALFAQRECLSAAYLDAQQMTDPAFKQRSLQIEQFIQLHTLSGNTFGNNVSGAAPVFRIPVVVHVIFHEGGENISDAQINSQLEALNNDFRRMNADTVNTPERFKPYGADVQIEFVLATADPKGRPTAGIVRKYSGTHYWGTDDKIKYSSEGGDDAWDPNSYLNIWVSNLRSLLGYSSAPGCSADKDGLVINYIAFGTINTAAPYNLGRTATHEIGHWLGLKHIWGDAACGDDLVSDTPPQSAFTPGCPSGIRSTCGNAPLGDMYMNYMDFTSDACMNIFTLGQKDRMRKLFDAGGPRNALLASKGLNAPWTAPDPVVEAKNVNIQVYPNPAAEYVNLQVSDKWLGKEVQIIRADGVLVQKLTISNTLQKISINRLSAGAYFITGINDDQVLREKFMKL